MATRLKAPERRNRILLAAAMVFGERGFEATRMEDVAEAAAVAKGLLYKHFPSKDTLFEAVLLQQGDQFATALRAVLNEGDPTVDPQSVLSRGFRLWVDQVDSPGSTFNFADPGVHDAYDDLRERVRREITAIISAAEPSTEPYRNLLVASALQGAAESMVMAWAKHRGDVSADELVELLTRFCWQGLSGLQADFRAGVIHPPKQT